MIEANLATACERTLVAAARAQRAATRQQLRAAARRFVRRHRRDAGYLRWVLRSVAASSALAVALLGLGAEPAQAKGTLFAPSTGAGNPLDGKDVGLFSTVALGDLDGDGDLDLVAGAYDGTLSYFENTGSATSPAFATRAGSDNPLGGQDVGTISTPGLGDLDGDGDLDVMAGEQFGRLAYFENTGSVTSPVFVARTGAANPLGGVNLSYVSRPVFADADADGDLDVLVGGYFEGFRYFENTGSATTPAFVRDFGDPFDVPIGFFPAPALGDLDADGDLDFVAGEQVGSFRFFENTGTATRAALASLTGAANPLDGQGVGTVSVPALGDLDADGDLDLVAGGYSGTFTFFENLTERLVSRAGAANPLDGQDVGLDSTVAAGDLDADGDLDVVVGEQGGGFGFYQNTGSAMRPALVLRTSAGNPLAGQVVPGGYSSPALGDLDADHDLDLVAGDGGGVFTYYENAGSSASPVFVLRTGSENPLDGESAAGHAAPALADVDADGDLDLLAGELSGAFLYFENTGNRRSPAFVERTGEVNPLDGQDIGDFSTPALTDMDSDTDLDLVAGRLDGTFAYFENVGSVLQPAFVSRTGAANPLGGEEAGDHSAPTLGDLDGDGDRDVVAGEHSGVFRFFENAIVKPPPSALQLTATDDPLFGQDAGSLSVPALGDLDGDGDMDVVAGEDSGAFLYFENTGDIIAPGFELRTGTANPLHGLATADRSTPALGDLDADGDLELVAGQGDGGFLYVENIGDAIGPIFALRTGAEDPLDGLEAGLDSRPALGDLDGDGDLDLLAGMQSGLFAWFENTGSATSPVFVERTGTDNPLDGHFAGPYHSAPALGDVDGDGDLDLVSGTSLGAFLYFENTGSATDASFLQQTGAANPLDGEGVDSSSAPALGDLDGHGGVDLVSGESVGTFRTYYLPEPRHGLLLGAGLALLSLLERLRGRRR